MPIYYRDKGDFKVISYKEVAHLINTAHKITKNLRDPAIIALVWITGARIGEVLRLRKEDIDIDEEKNEMRIRLITEKIPNRPIRELYLSLDTPLIRTIVMKHMEQCPADNLFNIGVRRAQQILKAVNEETGYWLTFHEFRHSRLTFLARNLRASVSEMMDWTGWKSTSEIGTYIIRGAPKRFKDKIR